MKKEIGMKERLQGFSRKAAGVAATGMAYAAAWPVYADTTVEEVTLNTENVDADKMVGQVLGIIMLVARFAGAALLIWGLVMFGLSVKNDEPESKQKALLCCIAGIILISLRSILKAAGIIS